MSEKLNFVLFPPPGSDTDSQELLLADLRSLVAKRQAVAVVGTGVSVQASGGDSVASWCGLLYNAIERCVQLGLSPPEWADQSREQLASEDASTLLSVADQVAACLGAPNGGEYKRWLRESVGSLRIQQPDILDALKSLGILIATTNYDSLLEERTGLPAVTWSQRSEMEQVLRGDAEAILHLHGHWKQPESVIFESSSYDRLTSDAHASAILRSLRTTKSLIFIGYGAGLSDPNFSELLRWSKKTFYGSEYRHYRLVPEYRVAEVQAQHPSAERIFAVSYGAHHDNLAPFLRELADATHGINKRAQCDNQRGEVASRPRVWSVPRSRNPYLTGRDELLGELQKAFTSEASPESPQVMAIHGLGGIGKTQVAVEYANRTKTDYDVVWWIRAEAADTLASDFAGLGYELGLIKAEASIHDAVTATRQWLEGTVDRWILVFDNARGPKEIKGYIPRRGTGHVLITSQNVVWSPVAVSLSVPVLSPSDSVSFLLKRTGLNDAATAADLAAELGHLPLALEQASAFIVDRGLTIPGYLDRFCTQRSEILTRGTLTDYEDTIATTWELAFRELTEQEPSAADLLKLIAYFAPDAIPLEILAINPSELPGKLCEVGTNRVLLDDAVIALRRYSLVDPIDDDTISVHRLVQAVTQDRLEQQGDDRWSRTAVALLTAAFPRNGDDVRTWPFAARLMPHAAIATDRATETGSGSDSAIELLSEMGMYLGGRAEFASARDVRTRSLTLAEAAYGSGSPRLAPYLNRLSLSLLDDGNREEAEAVLRRARLVLEPAEKPDRQLLATIIMNQGVVYRELGDVVQARACIEEGLALFEETLGPNHPQVSIALNNLAALLVDQDETLRAIPLLERALEISVNSLGPHHPDVAIRLSGFAVLAAKEGDLEDACEMYSRALEIDEEAYGHDHPKVADDLANLAGVKKEQGDLEVARRLLERAVAILSASAANPLRVNAHRLYLADVLQAAGMIDESEELIEAVFSTYTDLDDKATAALADAFQMLANRRLMRGKLIEARRTLQQVLPLWRRIGNKERVQADLHALRKIDEELRANRVSARRPSTASNFGS